MLRAVDFEVRPKILPLLRGLQVGRAGTVRALHHGVIVDQLSAPRHPLAVLAVADGLPAGEILAVEDGDRVGPCLGHGALQFGRAYGNNPRPLSFTALFDAIEIVAGGDELPRGGRSAGRGLGERQGQVSVIGLGSGQRPPGSAARLETSFQLAGFFGDFHPLRVRAAGGRRQGQIPAARIEGALLGRGGRG